MLQKASILIVPLFGLLFCACSRNKGDLSIEDLNKKSIWGYSSKITCADKGDCPNEVALLSYPDPEAGQAGFCTGTMIGESTLLTNAHCIPKKIRKEKASCDTQIWAVFPQTDTKGELAIGCQEVLYVAPGIDAEGGDSVDAVTAMPDFALIRLKRRPNRGHLDLSRAGFKEHDTITLYKSNPEHSNDRISSTLVKIQCQFSTQNQIDRGLISAADAKNGELVRRQRTVLLQSCESIGGNSGTAAIVDGTIRGVLFAGTSERALLTNFAFPDLNMLDEVVLNFFKIGAGQ